MPGDVVPFGKYKGQPVEMLAADRDYCEWLLAQPWFASRYGNVYNILIAYGGEPQDSPEHNQMQARFLDDEWCLALAGLLVPEFADGCGEGAARRALRDSVMCRDFGDCLEFQAVPASVRNRQFEDRGWDVAFGVSPASVRVGGLVRGHLPACTCQCDHAGCPQESPCHGGEGSPWGCRHHQHADLRAGGGSGLEIGGGEHAHCTSGCPWEAAG